ncbi:MAG TPA: UDP-N-acetylglucosamine 2-epimerase (non-hydrolyzing) [Anaerolineae bacterium]|nr:UDP-N-acetylglucosamine 2-epimerase (non-hydrolyzing) [Anaerolineae bacterium]HOQ98402.1 UDP-N-acetylglucosamine 2-epimerase (non-hydrolyzing) [Anaerolineae bacterium]HPL26486.1 UDP-N-acetylglucosamine 2-epimerase (non-hydrolyzing) [Anaerolineae bacterium]
MKVLTVVGARPQFIKAAPVSKALWEAGHHEYLVHTGQHYDYGMSQVFFDELGIPEPDANLAVGSGPHGWQTARMLEGIERRLLEERPDWVLVYGDTNSTLAGALAACKLHVPLGHIEAGLRSFNREMPEEHNRVLTDHCSDLLFCPTQTAVANLSREGISVGVHLVGDTMYDAVLQFAEVARRRSTILEDLGLAPKGYLLATVHRPLNTDNPVNLRSILSALEEIDEPVVFPVHPRTRQRIAELGDDVRASARHHVRMIEPLGYLDMLSLEQQARLILTDSGGMQKEAYFFGIPCITLRAETEWVETVDAGWNVLVGANKDEIVRCARVDTPPGSPPAAFGSGRASQEIVHELS